MILLADENFPRPAVEALRQAGLDVLWIAESNPGAPDDEVLALAASTEGTLLTFDKDFGELAYRRRLPAQCGIVLFRLTPQNPDEAASIALSAIQSQKSVGGPLHRDHASEDSNAAVSAARRRSTRLADRDMNWFPREEGRFHVTYTGNQVTLSRFSPSLFHCCRGSGGFRRRNGRWL